MLTLVAICPHIEAATGFDAQATQALVKRLEELRQQHHIPVLAVSLTTPRGRQTHVLGADPAIPLRWGSITKTVTALTVLALAQAGEVALDAPLTRYVAGHSWQNPWRDTHPVKVFHLLELRAGFTDLSGLEFDHNTPITLAAALALNPTHRTTRWPPGLQHGYSNLTPGLTQLLIERVTDLSYAQAVAKYVFTPLQMHAAGFSPRAELPGGFREDGKTPIPYWHMTFPAYGALNATLDDMNRLVDAVLATDLQAVLPAQTRQRLLVPYGKEETKQFTFDYAAGFYPRVRRGFVWHGHGGDADGYRSRLAVLIDLARAYVVNINVDKPSALRQVERLLEQHLTADLLPNVPPAAEIPGAQLQTLVGTYYPSSARFDYDGWRNGKQQSATIQRHDQGLVFTRNARSTSLFAVSPTQFRRERDPRATIAFVRAGPHLYLQGELGHYVRTDNCPDFLRAVPLCKNRGAASPPH